jgi:hypothetical protein
LFLQGKIGHPLFVLDTFKTTRGNRYTQIGSGWGDENKPKIHKNNGE